MRLFQNSGIYAAYLPRLQALRRGCADFAGCTRAFLDDRFGASHVLKPVLEGDASAFFTNGDDEPTQRLWAREHGLPANATLDDILLTQIEAHRTDVFYNLDPVRYGSAFLRRLPATVRRRICWRAAPGGSGDVAGYDLVVNNFPGILERYRQAGFASAYFFPAFDPACATYAARTDRPIDVVFVGGYSRHHRARAAVLDAVAAARTRWHVVFALDVSRATRWAESAPGLVLPLRGHRRPVDVRAVARSPVFGRAMYELLGQSKVVLNGAIDMAGDDRGNMRCFEAWSMRCALLSDAGRYPAGFESGRNLSTYVTAAEAVAQVDRLLSDPAALDGLRNAGHDTVCTQYSKAAQWDAFIQLCG
jgi:hypothetical protein